jgi:hypothetical protein
MDFLDYIKKNTKIDIRESQYGSKSIYAFFECVELNIRYSIEGYPLTSDELEPIWDMISKDESIMSKFIILNREYKIDDILST